MKFNGENLTEVLDAHKRWLETGGEDDGDRADFSGADLRNAILCGAQLYGADMRRGDLRGGDLLRTNLSKADLTGANLFRACLYRTDLRGAVGVPFFPRHIPDCGSFVGWKRAKLATGGEPCDHPAIVKLLIPEDAQRIRMTDGECRASKVRVLEVQAVDGTPLPGVTAVSIKDLKTLYRAGETVEEPNFGGEMYNKWQPGIYFYLDRRSAVEYMSIGRDENGDPIPIDFRAWEAERIEDGAGMGTPPAVINDPVLDRES